VITQLLLDFLSALSAGIIGKIPELPSAMLLSLNQISQAGTTIMASVAKLGTIVPFYAVSTAITMWVSLVGYFFVLQGVRLVLWLVKR